MIVDPAALHERLDRILDGHGPFPDGWADRLSRHLDVLTQWNQKINLVSRRSIADLVDGQLIPSLAVLLVVPASAAARVLDVGSGGGFPGVPLAIMRPKAQVDLVDATRKKCEFLAEALRCVSATNAQVHWSRIEAPSPMLRERAPFDVAIARGVGNAESIARAVRPLLRPGGALWTFVAPGTSTEELGWPPAGPRTAILRREAAD